MEQKLNVLIGCLFFTNFTGSEMYVYELARGLKKLNCDVSVVSAMIGGELTKVAQKEGIKVYSIKNPPHDVKFDIIHGQHLPIVNDLINLYPETKKICSIHSEIIREENPVKDYSIYKYIAIRPEIKQHIIKNFGIPESDIEVIYNPINEGRFNKENTSTENALLFVGTIDKLRKKPIFDLVEYTKQNNKEFWIVGENHDKYLGEIIKHPHVKYSKSVYNIEYYVKKCSETAGILLGRTTIEGWMCGKPGWIYNVDSYGNIVDKKIHEPPSDIDKFYSMNVTKKIKDLYLEILKK